MRMMMLALGTSTLLLGASAPVHVSAATTTPSTQSAPVTAACPFAFLPLLGPISCSLLGL
jgi:hypothetical protein